MILCDYYTFFCWKTSSYPHTHCLAFFLNKFALSSISRVKIFAISSCFFLFLEAFYMAPEVRSSKSLGAKPYWKSQPPRLPETYVSHVSAFWMPEKILAQKSSWGSLKTRKRKKILLSYNLIPTYTDWSSTLCVVIMAPHSDIKYKGSMIRTKP